MEAQLKRLGPNDKIRILREPLDGSAKMWLAGRGTCCHIYTKSKYASRKHFSITLREKKYFISDLQSANGTFVNDEKVTYEKILNAGDIISVGVPSNMQNALDCIVYVFEISQNSAPLKNSVDIPEDKDVCIIHENFDKSEVSKKKNSTQNLGLSIKTELSMNVDSPSINNEKDQRKTLNAFNLEGFRNEETLIKTPLNKCSISEPQIDGLKRTGAHLSSTTDESAPKVRKLSQNHFKSEKCELPLEVKNDISNIVSERNNSETAKGDLEMKKNVNSEKRVICEGTNDLTSEAVMEEKKADVIEYCLDNKEDEHMELYEASTQNDELEIKKETNLLDYSQTEELIEINDSDDEEWSMKDLKCNGNSIEMEEEDDVVFIEEIIKPKNTVKNFKMPLIPSRINDDLTETDKKWMDKLLKMKQEGDIEEKILKKIQDVKIIEDKEEIGKDISTKDVSPISNESFKSKTDEISTLHDAMEQSETSNGFTSKELHITEAVQPFERPKVIKNFSTKKSVTFDLVPEIRYFDAPETVKFSALEKGKFQFAKIMFNICKWNTVWLEECKKIAPDKVPPDICDQPLRKIPKKFVSHTDYMSAFVPAMILDLWNKVKENWKRFEDTAFRQTVSCDFCEDYEDYEENLTAYKCTGLVQSKEAHKQLIKEGHLVMLRLHQIQNIKNIPSSKKYSKKLGYLVFGFVEKKKYEKYQSQPLHEALGERCSSTHGDIHLVRLTILVKKRPNLKIDQEKLIQITVVDNIMPDIRKFRGICFLPQSPLCRAILKPAKVEFLLMSPSEKRETFFKGSLNNMQKDLVLKLSQTFASKESFLYSLHGAAGTGKGQVILALILELLYGGDFKKSQKPKIIYCNDSIASLDEMIEKLKKRRELLGTSNKFTLVRVAPSKEVKSGVKEFCLSNLAQNVQVKKFIDKIFDPEIQVLKQSDVICTTCSFSGIFKMIQVFGDRFPQKKNRKLICILDDASQSAEPTSLLPVLLGVSHLLLVGDPHQLEPPFSGEKTRFLGLDHSLFWRIHKNFGNIPRDLWPVFELNTQYRMNSSLSKFASKMIYNTLMEDSVQSFSHNIPNLAAFVLLVNEMPSNLSEKEKEIREGRLMLKMLNSVGNLIKISRKVLNAFVITCNSRQSQVLSSYLPKKKFPKVEINKVQSFQGREADVVIFFYNGSKISMSEINVAITRARSSLIIVTTELDISSNPWFQKFIKEAEEQKCLKRIDSEMKQEAFEIVFTT